MDYKFEAYIKKKCRYTEIILIKLTLCLIKLYILVKLLPTFLRLPMTYLQYSTMALKRKNLGVLKDYSLSHCYLYPSTI